MTLLRPLHELLFVSFKNNIVREKGFSEILLVQLLTSCARASDRREHDVELGMLRPLPLPAAAVLTNRQRSPLLFFVRFLILFVRFLLFSVRFFVRCVVWPTPVGF